MPKSVDDNKLGSLPIERMGTHRKRSWAEQRWHAMDTSVYPLEQHIFEGDIGALVREHIVPGHAPSAPLLDRDDAVVTLGSCFAAELRDYLTSSGFASGNFWIPSGLNNTYAILDFVSWCVTGDETERGFRYDRFESGEIEEWKPEEERNTYTQRLAEAGAFVFTLGLAEVWQDRVTGGVFWRGIPEEIFDGDRHIFRLTTVEENERNVLRIIELVRSVNAKAPIVLTLSPVPLKATFRGISCLTADCVSKSVLRVALDSAMNAGLEGVYYWPSFEIVRWAGAHYPASAYGVDANRARNVSRFLVAEILDAFVEHFYKPEAVAALREHGTATKQPYPTVPWASRAG